MNEVINAMITRRACRSYTDEPVAREQLEEVINAGLYAASGMNRQSTIILAVTDKETRDMLSKANAAIMGRDADPFYGAPAVLMVLAEKGKGTGIYDGSLVMGNLMLAAHSLGLATCWIHRAKEVGETEEFKTFLKSRGIEGEYEGIGNCIIGHSAVKLPAPPARKENRVFYID